MIIVACWLWVGIQSNLAPEMVYIMTTKKAIEYWSTNNDRLEMQCFSEIWLYSTKEHTEMLFYYNYLLLLHIGRYLITIPHVRVYASTRMYQVNTVQASAWYYFKYLVVPLLAYSQNARLLCVYIYINIIHVCAYITSIVMYIKYFVTKLIKLILLTCYNFYI